ncbi:MAG: Ig-like domain-containing protein, partial [Candidatus Omnitrophica bacterium]|nr:Ig-like domain-containing protein [Candidatus Omnitrophota bacterium]
VLHEVIERRQPVSASELGPDPGTFTVTRTGDTAGSLVIFYSLGGSARNGVDYERLPGQVTIPEGTASVDVTVMPIPDLDFPPRISETVVFQLRSLHDMFMAHPGGYVLGNPSNAVVTIMENSNAVPVVTVAATDPDAAEDGPDTGTFQVTRSGNTNDDLAVYYSLGGSARNGRDYEMLPGVVTIPEGSLTADITVTPILDVDRNQRTNETVVLQLRPALSFRPAHRMLYTVGWPSNAVVNIAESTTPPTNQLPVVRLVVPQSRAGFVAPADITLLAQARDIDGTVVQVEFFAGTNSLGVVTSGSTADRRYDLFSFEWTNVSAGVYTLTAVATDDRGATAASEPVQIAVTDTTLPIVTIVARDPIAMIGGRSNATNSATFVVRRNDATNTDLVVYYSISGTASNGVDYAPLPGTVTIPAGRHTADIEVTPLPDPLAAGPRFQSVVLTLQEPPAPDQTAPAYSAGRPWQAAVVIIDKDATRIASGRGHDGIFHLVMPAPDKTIVRLEVS